MLKEIKKEVGLGYRYTNTRESSLGSGRAEVIGAAVGLVSLPFLGHTGAEISPMLQMSAETTAVLGPATAAMWLGERATGKLLHEMVPHNVRRHLEHGADDAQYYAWLAGSMLSDGGQRLASRMSERSKSVGRGTARTANRGARAAMAALSH
jgi:hypothetical protein